MALRIKCKCGRPLKVSSKLADKKLTCPGCSRPFRIPLAKFKAAAAAAARRKAVRAQPAAQAAPEPVELDIQPANLDIEAPLAALVPIAKPAELDPHSTFEESHSSLLGDLVLESEQAQTESAPPVAVPVASVPPATTAYARESVGRRAHVSNVAGDSIEGPKRGFWADAFGAFRYPLMNRANATTLGVIVFMVLLPTLLRAILGATGSLGILAFPIVLVAFAVSILIFFWILALYLSVVLDTAAGSDDLPGFTMTNGIIEDVVKPAFKFIGACVIVFLPCILLSIGIGANLVPSSAGFLIPIWFVVGAFLVPISLILFSFSAQSMLLRPDLIFVTIARSILPYLAIWLMLLLVFMARLVATSPAWLASAGLGGYVPSFADLGVPGEIVLQILELYFMIVSMRIIGLYYLHFKKRFAIIME